MINWYTASGICFVVLAIVPRLCYLFIQKVRPGHLIPYDDGEEASLLLVQEAMQPVQEVKSRPVKSGWVDDDEEDEEKDPDEDPDLGNYEWNA